MEKASLLLMIFQGVVIGICLVYTACKIFKTKNNDWFPVIIWGLTASLLVTGIINQNYLYFSTKNDNLNPDVAAALNTIAFSIACVLFWEFSWGLFLISIEVQERLSQKPHWFEHKFRRALNILVLILIVASFVTSAVYKDNTTAYSFLLIQDAFCILSSIFYIWTLVNIHTAL